ncbi:MAG: hypothetical protein WCF30_19115, partial [Terracidiphilus sp.]
MAVFPRGRFWWYKFYFAGQFIRESCKSTSKTVAKNAESQKRRELEQGFNNIEKRRETGTLIGGCRVSPRARSRALGNSRWYRERQQHRRRDGVVVRSHPLPLQQFSLASSWAWSWWRRLLGIGRRICHATCTWIWFPMRE